MKTTTENSYILQITNYNYSLQNLVIKLNYIWITDKKTLKLRLPLVENPSKLKMFNIQLLVRKIGKICYASIALQYIFHQFLFKTRKVTSESCTICTCSSCSKSIQKWFPIETIYVTSFQQHFLLPIRTKMEKQI